MDHLGFPGVLACSEHTILMPSSPFTSMPRWGSPLSHSGDDYQRRCRALRVYMKPLGCFSEIRGHARFDDEFKALVTAIGDVFSCQLSDLGDLCGLLARGLSPLTGYFHGVVKEEKVGADVEDLWRKVLEKKNQCVVKNPIAFRDFAGAVWDMTMNIGEPPLVFAAQEKSVEAVLFFAAVGLQGGASSLASRRTPLMEACAAMAGADGPTANRLFAVIKALLVVQENPNQIEAMPNSRTLLTDPLYQRVDQCAFRAVGGGTALHLLVIAYHRSYIQGKHRQLGPAKNVMSNPMLMAFRALLRAGASPTIRDVDGRTVASMIQTPGTVELWRILEQERKSPMAWARRSDSVSSDSSSTSS